VAYNKFYLGISLIHHDMGLRKNQNRKVEMVDVVEHHLAGDCGIQKSAVVHDAGWSSVSENVQDSAEVFVQSIRPTTHDGGA
jgi:hypothetical protein